MVKRKLEDVLSLLDFLEASNVGYELPRSGTGVILVQVEWPGGRMQASFSPDGFEYRLFEGNEGVFVDDAALSRLLDAYDPKASREELSGFRALADRLLGYPEDSLTPSLGDIGAMVTFMDRLDAKGVTYTITREAKDLLEIGFVILEYRIEVAFTAEQARFSIFKTDGQVFTDEAALRALIAEVCS